MSGTEDHEQLEQVVHLLELLAAAAPVDQLADAPAPERARDLALRIGATRELHRRRESAQSSLLDIARELSTEKEPEVVLEAIVRRARTLIGTDLAYLTLYDPEAGDTFMKVTDGSVSADFQSLRLSLGDGLGGLVASTRKPYWTADYPADERFSHTYEIDHGVGDEGIIAICGTPLIVESNFVGVLFAANRSPRPFSRSEVVLLGDLAAFAALAIVQTRALADAQTAFAALTEAHETVRQQATGVARAAAAHDRFASVVLEGGGVADVTRALVDLLGGWAVLFDGTGERRSTLGPAPAPDGDRDALLSLPVVDRARHEAGRLVEEDGVHAIGVIASHEELGTLVVGAPGALEEADQRTVERAAVVTALVLLFERQADDARQTARNRLLADLLGGRGSHEERTGYLRSAGLEPREPMCLLVARGGDPTQQRALSLTVSTLLGEGSLVGTLVAYFAAGSSPRHAAGELHVHVNTVAQRLARVSALLGDDWQHPDRALEIQLALRMRRLLESR